MFGAISNPQLVAPSAGPGFMQKELGRAPRPTSIGTRPRGSASACRLFVGLISECVPAVLLSNRAYTPQGGAIAAPHYDATWRGVIFVRKMASAVL